MAVCVFALLQSGPYLLWLWGKLAGPLWHHTAPGDTMTQIETDLMEAERRKKTTTVSPTTVVKSLATCENDWGASIQGQKYKLLISGYDWRLLWLDSIY